jgi:restriction endonuclease S subunit
LNKTLEEQEDIKQQIVALSRKKDSLLNVLKAQKNLWLE